MPLLPQTGYMIAVPSIKDALLKTDIDDQYRRCVNCCRCCLLRRTILLRHRPYCYARHQHAPCQHRRSLVSGVYTTLSCVHGLSQGAVAITYTHYTARSLPLQCTCNISTVFCTSFLHMYTDGRAVCTVLMRMSAHVSMRCSTVLCHLLFGTAIFCAT